MKKIRESNYELLRIVAMFFIIVWHIIINGNILANTKNSDYLYILVNILALFFIVHVNIFMLITGYYQSKSKFKLKKLIVLLLEIWFYNFFINTFLALSGVVSYTKVEYLKQIMFYNTSSYWYIQCYIIIYLISPYLNKLIEFCSRKELKRLIIILLLVFSIIPFFTFDLFYTATGSTLEQYILLYFLGAYIRKYDLNKVFLEKFNLTQKRMIYITVYLIAWIINSLLFTISFKCFDSNNGLISFVSYFLQFSKFYYSTPIVLIQTLSLFLLFGTFTFKSKFINMISKLTLGVYFIHESFYIRKNIYIFLGIDSTFIIYSRSIILKILLTACFIYIMSLIIEFIRTKIFDFLMKIPFIKKIDKKQEKVVLEE